MRTNHGLTVPILDALSNLTIKPELLSEVIVRFTEVIAILKETLRTIVTLQAMV